MSGRLCQVRAARHGSFLDSVLELLTDDPPCLGIKKQRVVKFVMDAWLAPAGLRGGQILEARTGTSPSATLSSPLPPLIPRVENSVMDWAALSNSLLCREWRLRGSIVSSGILPTVLLGLVVWTFFISFNARWQSHVSQSPGVPHVTACSTASRVRTSEQGRRCHPRDFSRSSVPVSLRTRCRRWSAGAAPRLHEDPLSAMERGRKKGG